MAAASNAGERQNASHTQRRRASTTQDWRGVRPTRQCPPNRGSSLPPANRFAITQTRSWVELRIPQTGHRQVACEKNFRKASMSNLFTSASDNRLPASDNGGIGTTNRRENQGSDQTARGHGSDDNAEDSSNPLHAGDFELDVYMACSYQSNKLGVAYFDKDTGEIHGFQAVDDCSGPRAFQMLWLAKFHARPRVIYVSSKSDEAFLSAARMPITPGGPEIDVRMEKNALFNTKHAVRRLESVYVAGMPAGLESKDRLHWINSSFNLSAPHQLEALGALIAIMHKEGLAGSDLDTGGGDDDREHCQSHGFSLNLQKIAEIGIDGYLMVDPLTLAGLQIFQEERHPSAMGIGSSKEGFSVFGMMNRCVTPMGRRLLRLWFLRPMVNLGVINDRLDTVELLVGTPEITKSIRDTIKQVKDIGKLLNRLQSSQGRPNKRDFQNLRDSMSGMIDLRDLFAHLTGGAIDQAGVTPSGGCSLDSPSTHAVGSNAWRALGITQKVGAHVTDCLHKCRRLITDVIDFDGDDGMIITSGVCRELDDLKHMYHGLPDFLTMVVESELKRVPRELSRSNAQQYWSIVYVPQVGYLVQICGQPLGADILDVLVDYDLAFESTGEDGAPIYYYTCRCTEQLNARFGDILHKIHDMENSLYAELIGRVLEYKEKLQCAASVCAEVDCLAALAACAKDGRYTRPIITQENVLKIKNGRHLLTEMLVDTYIPNDTDISEGEGRIQIVTGPNSGGKSSYLKQVALMVYLSHIGSFVPADECVVGATDRIFSRMCSNQRTDDGHGAPINQSTFMVDLSQVATMMKLATPKSLLIIDEFGKGTLTSDGVGLSCAMLQWWAEHPNAPKILTSTHFSEVFEQRFLPRSPHLQFLTMNVVTDSFGDNEVGGRNDSCVLLYKLVPGCCKASFGVHCARTCGVAGEVVERAVEIIRCTGDKGQIGLLETDEQRSRDGACANLVESLGKLDLEDGLAIQGLIDQANDIAKGI